MKRRGLREITAGLILLGFLACTPLTNLTESASSGTTSRSTTDFDDAEELAYEWLCYQQDEVDGYSLAGLVDSFEDYWSEDSPVQICYTYDQAVAIIAFLAYGDEDRAEEVLSTMESMQDSDGYWLNSYWWNGYGEEIRKHVGPVIWMALAAMNYEIQTGDTTYRTMATDAIDWCLEYQDEDTGGIEGGETQWEIADTWTDEEWISTEHNIDAYAALTYFASVDSDKEEEYETAAAQVKSFLDDVVWDSDNNRFYGGYKTDGEYVDTYVPMDVNPWGYLALGDDGDYVYSLDYVEEADGSPGTLDDPCYVYSIDYDDDTITGYDYDWQSDDEEASDDIGGGTLGEDIWFEGSAFMSLAYYMSGEETMADDIITNIIKKQGAEDSQEGGIPYCLNGTNNNYWLMAQENCVSSTGWLILAINRLNPFTGEYMSDEVSSDDTTGDSETTDDSTSDDDSSTYEDDTENDTHSYDPGDDWSLYWSDSFNDSELNEDYWTYATGGWGWGNGEFQYYTDREDNVRIEEGDLVIELLEESYGSGDEAQEFTSGRIYTKDKVEFTYGKIVACIKMPAGGDYIWPAFWMLGYDIDDVSWPGCGEIDISEMFGGDLLSFSSDSTTMSTIHMDTDDTDYDSFPGYGYFGIDSSESYDNGDDLGDDYHYYGLEWDSSQMVFSFDGDEYQTVYLGEDFMSTFKKDYYFLLNIALGSWWWEDDLDADTIKDSGVLDEEQAMYVDWVRVYTRDGIDEEVCEEANALWAEETDSDTVRLYYNPVNGDCNSVSVNYTLNDGSEVSHDMTCDDEDEQDWYYDLTGLSEGDEITFGASFVRTLFSTVTYTTVDQDLEDYTFVGDTVSDDSSDEEAVVEDDDSDESSDDSGDDSSDEDNIAITKDSDGDITFYVTHEESMDYVQLFVEKSGIQYLVPEITDSESEDDGVYTYSYTESGDEYDSDDTVQYRFYSHKDGVQYFSPGPDEDDWSDLYTYSELSSDGDEN
ncbi:MAG: family 16 glycosylhydrolase [Spirochaetales bacterium]|nr:family 16 glycosylhydrolase [Spirochaetales bacterium]